MAQAFGEDVKQFIDRELDLKEVINAAREIQGWTVQEAAVAERRYRDFLWACWNVVNNKVPDIGSLSRFAAFSRSVDDVWHEHILWTEKYREDCARVFDGRFLDHVPVYAAKVNESDIKKAEKVYLLLNLGVPPDTIHECVWAIVG